MNKRQSKATKDSAIIEDLKQFNEETITALGSEENEAQEMDDPLGENETTKVNKLGIKIKETSKKSLIDDVVDAIFPRIKNPVGIVFGISESKTTKSQDQWEKRLLKHRIISMKNRFLLELEMPEKAQAEKERATAQSKLRREKRKAVETPEETAARKQRQRILAATSRKRIKELETPEQRAERMAKDREKSRLRLHKKLAAETPEERAARRQRQKEYELKKRPSCILTMKTGKIRGRTRKPASSTDLKCENNLNMSVDNVQMN